MLDDFDDDFVFPEESEAPSGVVLRPYQSEAIAAVAKSWESHRSTMVVLPTGCHDADQRILMYGGATKRAAEVVVGDRLVGPDLTPRFVQSLHRGSDEMVKVVEGGALAWRVNLDHVLSLVVGGPWLDRDQPFYDVTVRDFMGRSGPEWDFLRRYARMAGRGRTASWTSGFSLLSDGRGDYFGWTVDGDHRYLLPHGTVVHNCGKTVTAASILHDRAKQGRILWLAHRGELLDQAAEALSKRIGLSCEIEKAERRADRDGLFGMSDVVVGSVQTLRGKRLRSWDPNAFSTVVVDECHHAPARTYRQILDHFDDAKVLGLTATPDRGDGVAMGHVFTDCAYTLETRDAIRDGWLTPIVQKAVSIAEIDLSDVKTVRGDLDERQLSQIMEVEESLHGIVNGVQKYRSDRPTIVFCVSVAQSKELSRIFNDYGIRAAQIDGETPAVIRAERLTQFRTREIDLLVNVGVLTEGFDAPLASCVAIARPTKSRSLYAQMIGRGLRPLTPPDVSQTVEERKAALAASPKPNALVLDFVGNAGRHRLVNPIDILAGKDLPDDVAKRAKELAEGGMMTDDALTQAEAEAVERERLAEEKRKREAKIRAVAAVRARSVDPFDVTESGLAPEHRATREQLQYLSSFVRPKDLAKLEKSLSKQGASKLAKKLKDRRRQGLCTYAQAKVLARAGLRVDVSFETASSIIDWLSSHEWKPSAAMMDRFGVQEGLSDE